MMQREGVTGGALLAIGRNNGNLAKRLGGGAKAFDAMRQNPVVVRYEKTHRSVGHARSVEHTDELLEIGLERFE